MTTPRQTEANRRNALRSTGPRSPEGRAASSSNAVRHGILSDRFIAPHEDRPTFDALLHELLTEHEPVSALETMLIERLAILFWRERRLAGAEAEQVELQFEEARNQFGVQTLRNLPLTQQHLVGRYQGMLGRQIKDTLRDLRDEQDRRLRTIGLTNNVANEDNEPE